MLAVATVAAVVTANVPVRRYLGTMPPPRFYRPVDPAAVHGHERLFAVAHNAGDNVTTTTRAVRHDADVVEVDVIGARGTIAAGREQQPWPWLAERVFEGPTLAEIWSDTPAADAMLLDLKQNDRNLLDQLIA